MHCIIIHRVALQAEGNVKACLGFLHSTSFIAPTAVLRDVLVISGMAMLNSMLEDFPEYSVSAQLQFKVCFECCYCLAPIVA